MAKRNTAERATPTETRGDLPAITVTIGRDAANQGGATTTISQETLDSLQAKHGAPSPVYAALAFSTWDANDGLALGRKVATERILGAVPGFVQSVTISWDALTADQRAEVLGYHPAMLAVLLDETVKLRAVNLRYDARARAEGTSRDARDAAAKDALREGRARCEKVLRSVRQWATPAWLKRQPLPEAVEGAANPDALAATLDTTASWCAAWQAGWTPEERTAYEGLNFGPDLADSLHAAATLIRKTQEVVAAAADLTPATQRELDAQDGRVLHVVEKIYAAFRGAARDDAQVVVPELGALSTVFERVRAKPEPEAKKPDADPAKPDA